MITSGFEYTKVKKKSVFSGEKVLGFYHECNEEFVPHVKEYLDIIAGSKVYLRKVKRDAYNEVYFVFSVILDASKIYTVDNDKFSNEELIEQRFKQIQNQIVDFEIAFITAKTLKIGDPVLLLHNKFGRVAQHKCRVTQPPCSSPIYHQSFRDFEIPFKCGTIGTIVHVSSKRTHMSDCDVLTSHGIVKFPTLQLHPLYD